MSFDTLQYINKRTGFVCVLVGVGVGGGEVGVGVAVGTLG